MSLRVAVGTWYVSLAILTDKMSSHHGRNPWVPASWGGRISRPSPHSEPVGITSATPRGPEYHTRVSHIPPQQYRTVVEKRTAWYYTSQFGVSSSIALALTSFTRALRVDTPETILGRRWCT